MKNPAIRYEPFTRGLIILEHVQWWNERGWYCAWVAPEHRIEETKLKL